MEQKNTTSTPPEKPSGDNRAMSDNQQSEGGTPPENQTMQDFTPGGANQLSNLLYLSLGAGCIILSIAIMYAILSKFFKKPVSETIAGKKRKAIFIGGALILTAGLGAVCYFCVPLIGGSQFANVQMPDMGSMPGESGDSGNSEATGATTIESNQTIDGESLSSITADESVILVQNGGNLTLTDVKIAKTGNSTNTENSEFYGINAAILVTKNSTAIIEGAEISTAAQGANAVFATGENAKITIKNSTITSTGESSARGLDATYGGHIEADNVKITTSGGSCATLATDRGEGTVIAKNSTLTTNGAGSPLIYSTGDISAINSTGTANGSQIAVIEGKNSATIESSTFSATGAGNRGDVDRAAVMIYQSMSGDASEGTGTFTAKNSTLTLNATDESVPFFFITNTDAVINLENTTLDYSGKILLSAQGTSEWGTSGQNGGQVAFNVAKTDLTGAITMDDLSSVILNLDAASSWTLSADSYLTALNNADANNSNIHKNGYKLYVNGVEI